ncbi:MAG: amidohydrolase family protein [Pseudomonadales bacterium]|nr:amidohydrolase family protein [Pseudomonadales bacterium]
MRRTSAIRLGVRGLRQKKFATTLLVFNFALVSACSAPVETTNAEPSSETTNAVSVDVRTAVVTEGTNMAVTAAGDRRVISLQGRLFSLDGSGTGTALTDAYFDAREPQLSTDGSKVVFHGYRGGNWDIWEHNLETRETSQLTMDGYDDREPQYGDGGVVFSSDRAGTYDVWVVKNGELAQVTETEGNAYSPSLSTSGELAYVDASAGISRLMIGRDPAREVTAQVGTISGVQWSPDGSRLSYQLLAASGAEMRLVDIATGEDASLTRPGEDVFPFRASWQANDNLLYTSDGLIRSLDLSTEVVTENPFSVALQLERHNYERKVRDYDPEQSRQALGLAHPVVSNSGGQVYFTALGDIWALETSANKLTQLTDSKYAESGLALRPDGRALAYIGEGGAGLSLQILDLETNETRSIDVGALNIANPSWAPDGGQIAMFVDVPGNPLGGQIIVVDVASGEKFSVLSPMPQQPISWDESGEHIAVTRLNTYSSRYREGMYELIVAKVAGGPGSEVAAIHPAEHRSIVSAVLKTPEEMTYVEGGVLYKLGLTDAFTPVEKAVQITNEVTDMPSWSPDGSHLVYLAGDLLKLYSEADGSTKDVTPELSYKLATPSDRYVVRAGRLYTGEGNTYLSNQDIRIEGSRIVAIGASDPNVQADVDASQYTVTPGLFEMHAHMGDTSERQGRVWLSYGVTTVRDPGSNPYVAKERQEAWDSGRRIGPRTHVTGYLTDGNRVYYSMAEGIVSDDHLTMALNRAAKLDLDFIKTYVRLPDHLQKKVVDFAHANGMPVSSHELYPAVAHGMDHVEHIGGTSRRGYQPKVSRLGYSYQDVVELLSVGGMGMTATAVLPGFAVIVQEEPDWFETPQFDHFYGERAKRGYEIMVTRFGNAAAATAKANGKILRALTERDALLVTGTDSPFVPYGAGLHAELRLYARAGLTPAQILHQATMKSAQAAGVADELGSVSVGKLADLVIVDGDPLNEIRDMDNVVMTIKHGHRFALETLLTD